VGVRPDGTLAEGFEDQHDQIWQNTLAILTAANMGPENIVHFNVYSTTLRDSKSWQFIGRSIYPPGTYPVRPGLL
jgi:enamine deaminase RidA (YjgF/YER057c/UK114 family)